MSYASPIYGAAPYAEYYYPGSPSPTPSPRHNGFYPPPQTPQRPATRAHFRHGSSGQNDYRTAFSPRYKSTGEYATGSGLNGPVHEKERTAYYEDPIQRSATRVGHTRRASQAAPPQRPATVRPSSSQAKKASPPPAKATEADALKHRIPAGYSLKNWDPTEEPIMLLGSVFDSNSLGKWIYDWTVYHHGPATPISEMAGELWLLLIQLSGKVKRSEECVPRIRTQDNREMIEDFIESGERLTDKLRQLLKRCETPMLKASKRKDPSQLGKGSGVEFVETLFGRERELEKTERFMQSVRLWNLRFDANCEEILKKPTM